MALHNLKSLAKMTLVLRVYVQEKRYRRTTKACVSSMTYRVVSEPELCHSLQ